MKRFVYGTLAVALAVTVCGMARAEGDRKEGERREGERREGERREGERHGDGERPDAQQRDMVGSFVKADNGALQLRGGEVAFFVVVSETAKEDVKEKIKNADALLIGKGVWNVRGLVKKDSAGKPWIAVENLMKREGEGDRRREGGDGERRRREGGDGERKREGGEGERK
ncbi:MAG: hypothetical protein KIS92_24660 [Planctomycetota bacterium]|nr:hypothetical protein [Planctomycetota bacterium]